MKKSKLILLWVLTFAAGALAGGGIVFWNAGKHSSCGSWTRCGNEYSLKRHNEYMRAHPELVQAALQASQLAQAGLPEGLRDAELMDNTPKSSAQIPSQLVRTDLPEDIVIGGEVASSQEPEARPSGVVLSDGQNTVVLNSQKPAQRAADGTNITMIEAPVQAKRIKTLDEYKAFKREARGSYPTADFATEEVIVLESASNLPDKVFEIVDVMPEEDVLKVRYRVNVFGLGDKINTHSAKKISKSTKNIILEQVL